MRSVVKSVSFENMISSISTSYELKFGMIECFLQTASVVKWSEFLATHPEARVRFPALPQKKSSGSGTGSTQPREYN
jgi:hypothetical protein